jgi:hypothetical protein
MMPLNEQPATQIPEFPFDWSAVSWEPSVRRLWSLGKIMNVFKTREIGTLLLILVRDLNECVARSKSEPQHRVRRGSTPNGHIAKVLRSIRRTADACKSVGLEDASKQIHHTLRHVRWQSNEFDYSALCAELRHVINAVMLDVDSRTFLQVDLALREFVDNDELLGKPVLQAFPDAKDDIREAGNCLAAGCSTAAVFHLMRVAEHGLRALAYDRRLALPKDKPIDLATWEDLLKELEKAEDAIRNFPKTEAREAQFDFFHGAMMELKRFKNKFRNRVMHTRESYDHNEAMSAFDHVKAFMQILASKISAGTQTPLIW